MPIVNHTRKARMAALYKKLGWPGTVDDSTVIIITEDGSTVVTVVED